MCQGKSHIKVGEFVRALQRVEPQVSDEQVAQKQMEIGADPLLMDAQVRESLTEVNVTGTDIDGAGLCRRSNRVEPGSGCLRHRVFQVDCHHVSLEQ